MHLKAGLKLLELSDRKAIAVYRQTAIQLFKYAVYHLQSKKETFRLILGYNHKDNCFEVNSDNLLGTNVLQFLFTEAIYSTSVISKLSYRQSYVIPQMKLLLAILSKGLVT